MPSLLHKQQNLAVLIDAENASATLTRALLERAACYGVLSVKRAYADWSKPGMQRYKALLRRFAVEPIHTFSHVKGKNSADALMGIDAMDLLHSGQYDGFCLATSDSDFTHLAIRMRREGLRVYGFGVLHTPEGLVQACTRFIYVEALAV